MISHFIIPVLAVLAVYSLTLTSAQMAAQMMPPGSQGPNQGGQMSPLMNPFGMLAAMNPMNFLQPFMAPLQQGR